MVNANTVKEDKAVIYVIYIGKSNFTTLSMKMVNANTVKEDKAVNYVIYIDEFVSVICAAW